VDGTINLNTVDLDPSTPGIQTTFTNAQGTWTVSNGIVTFTPASNFNGTASISYVVNDNSGATSNSATITVNITPVNDAPVANNDSATTNEDTPVTVNVCSNDTDVDGTINLNTVDLDPSTPGIQTTFTNAQGTWTVSNGIVTFTPALNFNGTATISYVVNDNSGATSNSATITVNVTPVNDAPVANNDSATTNEDTPVTLNVCSNDTDVDGTIDVNTVDLDPSTPGIQTTFMNAQGTWTVSNGIVTFTPASNFNGPAIINYQVNDNNGGTSNLAFIQITVIPFNDAPIVDDENVSCSYNGTITGDLTDSGDFDVDGTALLATTTPISGPSNGTIVILQDGTYTYTPSNNFVGTDMIVVQICDQGSPLPALCVFDTIFVTVNPCSLNDVNQDCDSDGLTNAEELVLGTDAFNPDSDGDGVIDGTEANGGTNPTNPCSFIFADQTVTPTSAWNSLDCDNDGLSNGNEIPAGTDPTNPDTDGDGVLDGTEVTDTTNPIDPCSLIFANQTVTPTQAWNQLDCDLDGLTNGVEITLGLDPTNPDTDGDGVIDGTEVSNNTNPSDPCSFIFANQTVVPSTAWNSLDCDNDGLTNIDELLNGTNPTNPDSDGDGVLDGTEVNDNTNPTDPCSLLFASQTVTAVNSWSGLDCDNDGLSNGNEVQLGTDPTNPDSDGDGVLDGIEVNDGTNPINPCDLIFANQTVAPDAAWLTTDCDGDGLSNGEEVENGNDPNDPCDPLTESSLCNIEFDIPEAFSPDGDGVNEFFVIKGIERLQDNEIIIFNRWGSEVFQMNKYDNTWDGKSQNPLNVGGDELPSGTYFYLLDTKTTKYGVLKGYIYLKN
jgi:gliding motility-associated-like protein